MSRGFALILACGASLFSFGVQASPIFSRRCKKRPLISYWCGTGVAWASIVASMVIVFATAPWLWLPCSGSVACSSCASAGGCPACVPLRLLPWSLWPLLAVLNTSVGA